jgi:hypothetical protein
VDCKCQIGTFPLAVTSTTSYLQPSCYYHKVDGSAHYVTIHQDVQAGNSIGCYFPGFKNPNSGEAYRATFKIVTGMGLSRHPTRIGSIGSQY